jgi:hypothetical protein
MKARTTDATMPSTSPGIALVSEYRYITSSCGDTASAWKGGANAAPTSPYTIISTIRIAIANPQDLRTASVIRAMPTMPGTNFSTV